MNHDINWLASSIDSDAFWTKTTYGYTNMVLWATKQVGLEQEHEECPLKLAISKTINFSTFESTFCVTSLNCNVSINGTEGLRVRALPASLCCVLE